MELRGQTSLFLSNQQASAIISLWQRLDDYDKQRVVYAARHQERLLSGRFRIHKKPKRTPGVESTTRCVLGASSAPAQWPDCCRLVECIFIRLCFIHPNPVRKGKGADSRWSLILRDYRKIRQLVVGNSLVMQGTEIQLVEVNQNTLIQWHNNRQKNQELSVLLQGSSVPTDLPESAEPLQEARVLPAQLTPAPAQQEHQYRLPESTAGQAQQRKTAASQLPRPILPKGLPVVPQAPGPFLPPPILTPAVQTLKLVPVVLPVPVAQANVPQTSVPIPAGQAAAPPASLKRPYRRSVEANTCKKCGQYRTAETGHSQYRGRVYCPQSESLSKDDWLEEVRKRSGK